MCGKKAAIVPKLSSCSQRAQPDSSPNQQFMSKAWWATSVLQKRCSHTLLLQSGSASAIPGQVFTKQILNPLSKQGDCCSIHMQRRAEGSTEDPNVCRVRETPAMDSGSGKGIID